MNLIPRSSRPTVEAVAGATDPVVSAELAQRWMALEPDGSRREEVLLRTLQASRTDPATRPPTDLRGVRLLDADLSGLDLSHCDLSAAELAGADLTGTRLLHAKLVGTGLSRARLADAELSAADLSGADLTGANAERAGLGLAKLDGAKLFEANLEYATLSGCSLKDADLRLCKLAHVRGRGVDLSRADLSKCDLRGAELDQSSVREAVFDGADLRGSSLRSLRDYENAHWIGVDLRDIDFTGAYMCRRHIMDQNYLEEFRSKSGLLRQVYFVWWLTSDCGKSFLRWALWTVALAAVFGVIYTGASIDYGDYETWLSPFYYSVVTLTTLGYGDALPSTVGGQLLAMVEVSIGYVMLGGLLSIFSNKMARRAE